MTNGSGLDVRSMDAGEDGAARPGMALTPAELVQALVDRWPLVIGLPMFCALLLGILTLIQPREYSSRASFMPQTSGGMQMPFSGLAAQFGVRVPTADPGQSPEFYADLLRSNTVMESIVATPLTVTDEAGASRTATLVELYGIDGGPPDVRRDLAIQQLSRSISVGTGLQTGIVRLTVTAESPEVAHQIATHMLERVTDFNLRARQTQAAAERRFIEERLQEVAIEVRTAQGRLEEFLRNNRIIQNSPELQFQRDRLQTELGVHQSVFASLSEANEEAKIREVRNTPVITLLDPPSEPARPDPRGLVTKVLLGGLFGFGLALLLAFGGAFWGHAMRGDEAGHARLRATVNDPLRRLRRGAPVPPVHGGTPVGSRE